MSFVTTKEQLNATNGLGCLVQALIGTQLTIDLRNEATVIGRIAEVDGYMNMSLENAILEDCHENLYQYNNLFINGRSIRFIHIPKELSVRETVAIFLKKFGAKRSREPITALQRLKAAKLQQYQKETRRNVEDRKTEKK